MKDSPLHFTISLVWVRKVKLYLLGIGVFLLSLKPALAQPNAYDQYSVDNGLPSNYVYRIAEDESGYLWAATEKGLARFDGYEWRSYGLSDGLTGLDIYEMSRLPSGELIVGGAGFLPMIISNGEVKPFEALIDTSQVFQYLVVNSYPCLVSRISPNSNQFSYAEVFSSSDIKLVKINNISQYFWIPGHFFEELGCGEVFKRNMLVASHDKFFYLKYYFKNNLSFASCNGQLFSDEKLFSACIDSAIPENAMKHEFGYVDESEVQIWYNSMLYIYDSTLSKTSTPFEAWSKYFDINIGMRSRSGDYWLATRSSGIIRISAMAQKVKLLADSGDKSWEGILSTSFGTVVADDHSDLYKYEFGRLKPYKDFHASYSQSRFRDLSIMPGGDKAIFSRDNRLFFIDSAGINPVTAKYPEYNPTDSHLWQYTLKVSRVPEIGSSKSFQASERVFTYGNNYIWYTVDSNLYHIGEWQPFYTTVYSSNHRRTTAHYVDQHRLYELDFANGKLAERWQNDSLSILTAIELSDNKFLLGTENLGVFSLDLSADKPLLTHALACGPVKELKVLDGDFWAATYTGVYRFSESGDVSLHLKKGKGLLTDEVYDMDLAGDSILIATANGLAIIDKGLRNMQPKVIPNLHVTWREIRVDGLLRQPKDNQLELLANEDNLELSFEVLHPNHDDDIEYQIQLFPIDEAPRKQRQRTVRYASLAPGEYELSVQAIFSDGTRYSLERPLNIALSAPLHQRPWFIVLSSLALGGGIFMYVRQRERTKAKLIKIQQNALRRTSELQLESLRSQMNPHFIFNALGSIQYFIQTEAKEKADEFLGRFAHLMRGYLDGSKRNLISVSEEISTLRQYLELEKMRVDNKFTYAIDVDPQISDQQLFPSMLLQPLVENAILHGLAVRNDKNAKLEVVLRMSGKSIIAIVRDNGQGVLNSLKTKRRGHVSRASEIMQARIEALRQAGIADVNILYETNNRNHSVGECNWEKFPGTQVTLTIKNIQEDD